MGKSLRFLMSSLALVISLTAFSGCSKANDVNKPSLETTENGYLLTPGINCEVNASNTGFSYIVSDPEQNATTISNLTKEAQEIVREWWNNDDTFIVPKDVLDVTFYGNSAPRAFQEDGYIFIDIDNPDSKATLVHEFIHLQNEFALMYDDGVGRELLEMYVEKVTFDLVGAQEAGIPTSNYVFFSNCPKLLEKYKHLDYAYKNHLNGDDAFFPLWGNEAKDVAVIIDSYDNLYSIFSNNNLELNRFLDTKLGITEEELSELYAEDFSY